MQCDSLIEEYFLCGYTQTEMRAMLAHKDIVISDRQFKRHLARLQLFRRKCLTDVHEVATFIQHELESYGQLHGYKIMHQKCVQAGLVVTRETVRQLMSLLDDEGVDLRRHRRICRRRYLSKGSNFVWHMDSYDKLKPYGICINGCIDGFSRKIIWLEAYYTSSDPTVIAGNYLKAVAGRY